MRLLTPFIFLLFAAPSRLNGEFLIDFECLPGYNKTMLEEIHKDCRENLNYKMDGLPHLMCVKACVFTYTNMYETSEDVTQLVYLEEDKPSNLYSYSHYFPFLIQILNRDRDLTAAIGRRILNNCNKYILKIREEKRHCDNWKDLEDCCQAELCK